MEKRTVPMQKRQAPGFYRIMLGDYEVTALSDGMGKFTPDMCAAFTSHIEEEMSAMWDREFGSRAPDGTPEASINAFLVHTGEHLILMDAGKGEAEGDIFYEKQGLLRENLTAAGYRPEDIDILLPTHLHTDHVNGIAENGRMAFPNAMLYIAEPEGGHWLDTPLDEFPESFRETVQEVRNAVDAYRLADRVQWYTPGEEVLPHVRSVPLFGHTPGHTGFAFESRGEKLLVWGDFLHVMALQLADMYIGIVFDTDAEAARQTRREMLPKIAADKLLVAGAHLPFPGIGHIRQESDGYHYIPVEYRLYFR